MAKQKIEIVDRYSATGTPYPDENSCDECEGMGLYPIKAKNLNKEACKSPTGLAIIVGQKEKDGSPMPDDGWLMVRCPICHGSKKKPTLEIGKKAKNSPK